MTTRRGLLGFLLTPFIPKEVLSAVPPPIQWGEPIVLANISWDQVIRGTVLANRLIIHEKNENFETTYTMELTK
jgi:hypothetical protein